MSWRDALERPAPAEQEQRPLASSYPLVPSWPGAQQAWANGPPVPVEDRGWWWLAAHGGAGVSTLEELVPGGADAHGWWPDLSAVPGPARVLIVCRTHVSGLAQAWEALDLYTSGAVSPGLELAGLVAVADAPGKLSRPQTEILRVISGSAPRTWTVAWVEDLRYTDPRDLTLPPAMARLSQDLDRWRCPAERLW